MITAYYCGAALLLWEFGSWKGMEQSLFRHFNWLLVNTTFAALELMVSIMLICN